ncbi:MAG: hypothetical protein IKN70_12745 [Fibrobacter sp.]|nr:hypothetical protein [Fibrobacter sp.]
MMVSRTALFKTLALLLAGSSALALFGCGCPAKDGYDWDSPSPAKLLETYHKGEVAVEQKAIVDDSLLIYQDFSDGFQEAWKDANSMEFYRLFVSSLKISAAKFFVVGEKSLDLIAGISEKDLFARVTNPKNYNRNYAALDNALNKIVSDKKRAVFVTDGELFSKDGGESELPWAREGFAKWLKDGNKLSFYVTDFIEKKKKKHVFYMIFTPADEIGSKADVTDALEYALKNMQVPGSELKYVSFHFQNNAFGLEKGFSGKAPGSLSGDLEVMEDSYALNSKGNWEYADVALNWSGIYTYFVENAVSEKTGKPIKGGYPLIGKRENSSQSASLALNATALEFYKVNSVKLRVKDIHDDFMSYATEAKCLQNPQEVKKRDNGEVEIDPETEEPIIIKEGEPGCFDGKGNLLPEFKYSPKPAKVVTDVFVLNTDHFNETMMHNAKGEIEIQLAPNFEETSALTCDECSENFLKLELIVDDVVPVTSNPNLQNFIWEGQKLPTNKAMYESVIMALRDAIPQGKVLYTWYIKAPFNDFK